MRETLHNLTGHPKHLGVRWKSLGALNITLSNYFRMLNRSPYFSLILDGFA